MIVQTRENKDLVIPKSLGNFVTEGSGGGITPEEAAEIASAVTEEAISEYDIELQVDLEEIRDAVSGNSEDISTLSGVTETISQQIGSLTDDIAAISGQTTANTQDIGILSGATVAIEQSLGNYTTTADTKAIQDSLSDYATTADTAAIQQSLGDYATTADTKAIQDSLADYSTTADTKAIQDSLVNYSTTADTKEVQDSLANYATTADTKAIQDGLDIYATTATTDGLATDISTLSGATSALTASVSALTANDNIAFFNLLDDYGTSSDELARLYDDMDAANTAGKTVVVISMISGETAHNKCFAICRKDSNGGFYANTVTGFYDGSLKLTRTAAMFKRDDYYNVSIKDGHFLFSALGVLAPYTLPTASSSTLGGIKVGSGLSIDNSSKLSVKAGEGLGFSGDTLVVSGISAGGTSYFLNNMTQAERADLASLLLDYWQEGNDNDFSSYPIDTMSIYWYLPDSGGAYDDEGYKDYVLLVPSRASLDTEWEQGAVWLMGSYAAPNDSDNCVRGFRVILLEDGSFAGVQPFAIDIPTIPDLAYVRFGNDEKGGLTYDADNGYFIYDSANVATGDTSSYQQDVIDYIFTKSVIDGSKVFGYLCPVGTFKFFVTSGGTTYTYSNPTVKYSELASPVTIDDVEFSEEVTFRYSEWELTAWFAGDNRGANLRIKAL